MVSRILSQNVNIKIKRAYMEHTIKDKSHSLDEMIDYIINMHGFVELDNDEVCFERDELRYSFIMDEGCLDERAIDTEFVYRLE